MRPNALVGLVAIVFGTVYGVQAINLPQAPIGNPMAPVYFPLGLGVLMALFGAILFITEARKGLNSDDKSKRPKFHAHSMKLISIVIGLCLLYTAMFDYVGFVFSTLFFLMTMLAIINNGKTKLFQNAIIALCFFLRHVVRFREGIPDQPSAFPAGDFLGKGAGRNGRYNSSPA